MSFEAILQYMKGIVSPVAEGMGRFLPNLVGAVIIVLIGHFIARLLSFLADRLVKNIGRVVPIPTVQSQLTPSRTEPSARLISKIIYWIILFFAVTIATEVIGLPVLTTWLGGIAGYLPKILIAVLITVCGIVGGIFLREIIVSAAHSAGFRYGTVLGTLAQYTVVVITILIAIDHVGIEVSFLTGIVMVILAAGFLGSALAFGLGARAFVSDILAVHYLKKIYQVGQTVRIGEFEGRIAQITTVSVLLDAPEGQVCVPAKQFAEMISLLPREESRHGY